MDRDGLLNFDEIFRFYLAVVRFPLKKASDTAQSFLDLGDINKDGKLSIKGTNFCHKLLSCETPCYTDVILTMNFFFWPVHMGMTVGGIENKINIACYEN